MSEKNKLAEKLLYAPKNGYDRLSAEDEKAMEAYCEDYKKFLNNGKTERLCVERLSMVTTHLYKFGLPRRPATPTV